MTVIEFKRRERKDRSILDGWKTYWQTKIEILRKKSFKTCLIFPSSIKHGKQSTREDLSSNKRSRYHSIDKETLSIWEWFGMVLLSKIDITTWCLWEEWHFSFLLLSRLLNNENHCHKFPDCEFINVYICRDFIFVFFISL